MAIESLVISEGGEKFSGYLLPWEFKPKYRPTVNQFNEFITANLGASHIEKQRFYDRVEKLHRIFALTVGEGKKDLDYPSVDNGIFALYSLGGLRGPSFDVMAPL